MRIYNPGFGMGSGRGLYPLSWQHRREHQIRRELWSGIDRLNGVPSAPVL